MATITLIFAKSELEFIDKKLRKKYNARKELSLEALCEKAILRETYAKKEGKEE